MKLRRIEIEHFRGFSNPLVVDIDDFTAFIGRNEIGKSTILSALTIFLEGEGVKIEKDDGCIHGKPESVRITCDFDALPPKFILDDQFETSLSEENLLRANGHLRITKIYNCTKTKITPDIFIEAESHPVDKNGESLLALTLQDLKKLAVNAKVELETGEATVKAKIRRAIVSRSSLFQSGQVRIPIGKNESDTLWKQILSHLPLCALFVSDRASSEKDKEAQSPMGIAVESALSEVQEELDKLLTHVERRVQEVADRTLAKLHDMNPTLASELSVTLRDKPKWKEMFKYTLNSNEGVPLDKRGSGVRRLVLLNFFRAEAERKSQSEGGRPVIYAIEEPETSQHPEFQKMLVRALLEISSKGGQVLVTTHAPGLAGEMPIESLRFLDEDNKGGRIVRSAKSEKPGTLFSALAERLGMLPDSQVRVLVCVEGMNDVRFLKHISRTLNAEDSTLPNLGLDPRFVFIPMSGGNLRDVVNQHLFRNFRKLEFHIYDRDGHSTYAAQVTEIESRKDGSMALQTIKRYMESYIHPEAIKRIRDIIIEVNDEDDYTPRFGNMLKTKKAEAKAILADEVAPAMTVLEIDERDGTGEIRSWLTQLSTMASL